VGLKILVAAGQDFFSDCLFGVIQRAVKAALRDARQSVSKCIRVARWAGFAAYSRHEHSIADGNANLPVK